jgi:hypothetical protein
MTNQTSALLNTLNILQMPPKTTVIWKQCNEYAGHREAITFRRADSDGIGML